MRAQVVGQDLHGARFLETDFRVAGNVVAHRQQLRLHKLFHACDNLIALWVGGSKPRDHRRNLERFFKIADLAYDVASGRAFRRRFLGKSDAGCYSQQHSYDWSHVFLFF